MASVELQQVRKTYDGKNVIIHGMDLHIEHGEFVVFVGPLGLRQIHLAAHDCRPGRDQWR